MFLSQSCCPSPWMIGQERQGTDGGYVSVNKFHGDEVEHCRDQRRGLLVEFNLLRGGKELLPGVGIPPGRAPAMPWRVWSPALRGSGQERWPPRVPRALAMAGPLTAAPQKYTMFAGICIAVL